MTVTVLSPLEYTGLLARLIDGVSVGLTPLVYQYRGRHISYWKSLATVTEPSAAGVTGKIQFGAEPGGSAQVMVPACAVPLAVGTEPNAPDGVVTEPLELLLWLQAARPRAAAMAPTASFVARCEMVIGFPRVGRSARGQDPGVRAWLCAVASLLAAFRYGPFLGRLPAVLNDRTVCGRGCGHIVTVAAQPPGRFMGRCHRAGGSSAAVRVWVRGRPHPSCNRGAEAPGRMTIP